MSGNASEPAEWIVFLAEHADSPVHLVLGSDVYGGLQRGDSKTWTDVLESVEDCLRARFNE